MSGVRVGGEGTSYASGSGADGRLDTFGSGTGGRHDTSGSRAAGGVDTSDSRTDGEFGTSGSSSTEVPGASRRSSPAAPGTPRPASAEVLRAGSGSPGVPDVSRPDRAETPGSARPGGAKAPGAHQTASAAPPAAARPSPAEAPGATRPSRAEALRSAPSSSAGPDLLVLKVGGSLVSDKRADDGIDTAALAGYARQVAGLARERPGRVVFVAGGGAFGHGAVRELRADDPFSALELTRATFAVKWAWVSALRDAGVAALPLQVAALAWDRRPAGRVGDADPRTVGAGTGEEVEAERTVLRKLLDVDAVPVLSGDCVLAADGRLRILGSDHVPGLLLDAGFGRVRIVTLTNVSGVLADGPAGTEVVPFVDPDAPDTAHDLVWESASWDTSDAMHGKLRALTSHARRGGECLIMRGDPNTPTLTHLFDPIAAWPPALPHTLIARRTPADAST
ncbi:aminotransferase [Streptomyces acidiscabies]|uniref:Aspartate/glutamate/uridylate kinase domain-containing protein n=3 Tax=Streptomyces acidiscabies TaxID=42234 RepID=A0AAP6EHB9_9ACTN|nr:aminotransferase [Streptomyces acidiscabies]MBP5934656.1 hypothetical protein [Streptomyces sp. LBUM 1476]MBZ3917624.1 hypothetical protein [Streptomyces acidiscabies]MDX2962689.1 hypothetical protein [Streptomyces acidiscabies]MDX3019004.1 hypothetical protein [Streptomyces acidiscabies]MDX3790324.1 hypothetical protein [Streptomyces acidiscabies]